MLGASLFSGHVTANHFRDALSELKIDLTEALTETLVDDGVVTVVKLEGESVFHVHLLVLRHGVVEELSLVLVLPELAGLHAGLDAGSLLRVVDVGALLARGRRNSLVTVGPVVDLALGDGVSHGTVTVEVHDGANRLVDWQLFPVDTQTRELGVLVGEVASLQKRVVAEADTRNDVACAEGGLLGLGEELVGVLVQLELTNVSDGDKLLRPDLGSVQDVKIEVVLLGLWEDLDTELPLGVSATVDSHPQVLAMEVGVLTSNLESLVPDETVDTELGGEVKLDEAPLALGVDECVGVDTETLHHTV